MDLARFERSLAEHEAPSRLSPALLALWQDRRGDWSRAHEAAQNDERPEAAGVHAYLHRKEGDTGNVRYWLPYRRAGRPVAIGGFAGEWRTVAAALLGRHQRPRPADAPQRPAGRPAHAVCSGAHRIPPSGAMCFLITGFREQRDEVEGAL
jgi:hypothetical protein